MLIEKSQIDLEKLKKFPVALKFINDHVEDYSHSGIERITPNEENILVESVNDNKQFESQSKTEIKINTETSADIEGLGGQNSISLNAAQNLIENKYFCLYSFLVHKYKYEIQSKDIHITKEYENEVLNIIENNKSNEEILKQKLIEKLEEYGLYIPLKIYFGGRFNIEFETNSQEANKLIFAELKSGFSTNSINININSKGNYNEENSFSNKIFQYKTIGGDNQNIYNIENIEKWIKTVNIDNSTVIAYDNLMPIYKFFSEEVQKKIEPYLECILNENKKNKEFDNNVKTILKEKEGSLFKQGTVNNNYYEWSSGINTVVKHKVKSIELSLQKSNEKPGDGIIETLLFNIKTLFSDNYKTLEYEYSITNNKFVGWKLRSFNTGNESSYWKWLKDPLRGEHDSLKIRIINKDYNNDINYSLQIFCLDL